MPPIAKRSPSPEKTITFNSGFANLSPIANGIALPCVVWNTSKFKYPEDLPVHPIPDTTANFSFGIPEAAIACTKQDNTLPSPHPLHHTCGNLSALIK